MKLTPKQIELINQAMMAVGALTVVLGPVLEYLRSGSVINSAGVIAALGVGLAAYAKKAPGHLTHDEAQALAHEHVSEAIARVTQPPKPAPEQP